METNKSFNITTLKTSNKKRGLIYYILSFFYKLSGILEVVIILSVWMFLFSRSELLGGFTREEMIAYIIIGNLIGLLATIFLYRVIVSDVNHENSKMLIYRPLEYLREVLLKRLVKNLLPFFIAVIFNSFLLFFLLESVEVTVNPFHLIVIGLMIILAFIIELLIAYIVKLFVFWTIESKELFSLINWLKKFLAGGFFPLSFLSPVLVGVSLFFPFAYSFYVPTELFLKKIDILVGIKGLGVQTLWIIVLYLFIKIVLDNRLKKEHDESQLN
ncbi:ABC-2 family transporter protein [bacterium]|nr:ABC-2 family transporter protein [bacterium]